uniref:Uncharacterized protein n=1 Tax=Nelumbo nucifera TaxID=4432 RepID=A0A822YJE7_NELNU|nr:TPA_asm: hypothetical protein HUJ06_011084 [Nelumbo nucifera]
MQLMVSNAEVNRLNKEEGNRGVCCSHLRASVTRTHETCNREIDKSPQVMAVATDSMLRVVNTEKRQREGEGEREKGRERKQ